MKMEPALSSVTLVCSYQTTQHLWFSQWRVLGADLWCYLYSIITWFVIWHYSGSR